MTFICAVPFGVWILIVGYNVFFLQAEDGIRDLVRSRGLGDVYKRQVLVGGWYGPEGCMDGRRKRPHHALGRKSVCRAFILSLIHI